MRIFLSARKTLMEVHFKFSICGTHILHVQIGFLMIMVLEFVLVKRCWLFITTTWQLTNSAEVVWGDEFFRLLSHTKSSGGGFGESPFWLVSGRQYANTYT